jgi:hypothetical protein
MLEFEDDAICASRSQNLRLRAKILMGFQGWAMWHLKCLGMIGGCSNLEERCIFMSGETGNKPERAFAEPNRASG